MDGVDANAYPCRPADGIAEVACCGSPREMGLQQGRAFAELTRRGPREVITENPRIEVIRAS